MSPVFEFHDSEVRDVSTADGRLRVRFSAATVLRGARERGWLADVTLTLTLAQGEFTGDVALAFGKLADGSVDDGALVRAALPLPSMLSGGLTLQLRFANGASLLAHGSALELSSAPEAAFAEDLAC
jgi:hypothetical protein